MTTIESVEPATETIRARFDPHSAGDVTSSIAETDAAYRVWREVPIADRAVPMRALAQILRDRRDRYARLITTEMGKPISEALAEIEKCALTCDFYADRAAQFLADERVDTNARESFVAFEPLGVILAVMPWNYPFWQVIRFLAPALMAGNAALLKHASNVPQCALALEEAVRDAGFPKGLLRALLVPGALVEPVIADDRVRAVTLTGSTATGSRIAELAGRAVKKTVLELGGSDPFMEAPIAAEFERRFADAIRALRVGDPLDPSTQVGPLAREDLRQGLERQVAGSVRMGARVVVGGKRRSGKGWFYEPTLLAGVTEEMPVLKEETFGPVAALLAVRDADEAVRVANRSPYGLGAALWTADLERARALARRIESGSVFINGMVASDPRLPFGGTKQSGYGRELSSFGIREFVNIQTIWIGPATVAPKVANAE